MQRYSFFSIIIAWSIRCEIIPESTSLFNYSLQQVETCFHVFQVLIQILFALSNFQTTPYPSNTFQPNLE